MKTAGHPQYFEEARVTCVCGNTFTTGSTQEVIRVELCNKCHPFYTGEQRFIDTRSIIKKFQDKQQKATAFKATQTKKKEEQKKRDDAPKTLREMLQAMK